MSDKSEACKHCGYDGQLLGLTVSVPDHMGGTGWRGKPVQAEDLHSKTVYPGFHKALRLCPSCERINIL